MKFLEELKERWAEVRNAEILWEQIDLLSAQLRDASLERAWWQNEAVNAQLEAEQLKDIVKALKS